MTHRPAGLALDRGHGWSRMTVLRLPVCTIPGRRHRRGRVVEAVMGVARPVRYHASRNAVVSELSLT